MHTEIDITFDFRLDTPTGKDPDTHSKTLRRYHRLLWSKRLPSGEPFDLSDTTPGKYLHHRSAVGEFFLSSDTLIPSFRWVPGVKELMSEDELEAFHAIQYTIGGMMIFPGNRIEGRWTINQARGCTRQIGDRFDLTLECIRRYYGGGENPLSTVLQRYKPFFALFENFRGYVEFFLLQDLVSPDFAAVKISEPFDDFVGSPIPYGVAQYKAYKRSCIAFIEARNRRILASFDAS